MAQIRGFSDPARMNLIIGPMSSPREKAFRSMPAQKPLPAPVSTPAVSPGSPFRSWMADQRPLDRSPLMAFMASGRLRVMTSTRSRRSVSTAGWAGSLVSLMTGLLSGRLAVASRPRDTSVRGDWGTRLVGGRDSYLGGIRMPPSTRITSPFMYGLVMSSITMKANSSPDPSRLGNRTDWPRWALKASACSPLP